MLSNEFRAFDSYDGVRKTQAGANREIPFASKDSVVEDSRL